MDGGKNGRISIPPLRMLKHGMFEVEMGSNQETKIILGTSVPHTLLRTALLFRIAVGSSSVCKYTE
jgi:hypothetical protein